MRGPHGEDMPAGRERSARRWRSASSFSARDRTARGRPAARVGCGCIRTHWPPCRPPPIRSAASFAGRGTVTSSYRQLRVLPEPGGQDQPVGAGQRRPAPGGGQLFAGSSRPVAADAGPPSWPGRSSRQKRRSAAACHRQRDRGRGDATAQPGRDHHLAIPTRTRSAGRVRGAKPGTRPARARYRTGRSAVPLTLSGRGQGPRKTLALQTAAVSRTRPEDGVAASRGGF
jgi:hypothetical protein